MAEASGVRWLFLDLNSYFASVEQQINPALRGRPVAVVPVMTDATCAIAASYEAKAFGVRTGTPIYEAKRLCPGLVLVLAQHDRYVRFHRRIVAEVENHVPVSQVCSIDEMACALVGRERETRNAVALARRIKDGIVRNVGECLRCSVGLAPNRFLAKVATEIEKPDGLVTIEPHELPGKILGLGLRDFPGIGANMERRLRAAGVADVATLWAIGPRRARQIWGSIAGESFWYMLHGIEVPERASTRRTVGHSHVLAPDLRRPEEARLIARRLAAKAASRLRRLGYRAATLDLGIRFPGGGRWMDTTPVPRTNDTFTFLAALDRLWRAMLAESGAVRIKKVSVTLHDLAADAIATPDLFATLPDRAGDRQRRREKLSAVMDSVNQRYGRDTVILGALPNPQANFSGTKVAFTRIPDLAEFYE
jgi:DNA polymerase-4